MYLLNFCEKLNIYKHRLIQRFCLDTILNFTLFSACKNVYRVEELWFSLFRGRF